MSRRRRFSVALLAIGMLMNGCYGPFNLTRQVYRWNGQIGEKWPREFMFLILTWAPVYGIAALADAVVFNAFEFWSGKNPVESPRAHESSRRRLVRGMDEAILTYTPLSDSAQLRIELFQHGKAAGSLNLRRQGEVTVGSTAEGSVSLTAQSFADGSILVRDGSGKQMAAYSAEQVEQILGSSPHHQLLGTTRR